MKATIDGITYEGTEEEIRHMVENPPHRSPVQINYWDEWGRNIPPPPRYAPSEEPYRREYEYTVVMC